MARVVSGITATGKITIGNYCGALKNFIKLQDEHELYIFIANLHAITLPIDKTELKQNIKAIAGLYLATGLDPKRSTIFVQSDVLAHAQLGHILLCNSSMGELSKMTQYKDKSKNGVKLQNGTSYIPTGLFTYPTLMAADILLYDPELVPVGADQKQHIELTRNLATRMNHNYGDDLFKIPEEFTPKEGARIMSLQNPENKMSKSDTNKNGAIFLLDPEADIRRKIAKAVTDSDNTVKFDKDKKPGVSNLMTIYSEFGSMSIKDIEAKYKDLGYKEFKEDLANLIVSELTVIQNKYNEVMSSGELDKVLDEGADKANKIAYKKLQKVQNRVGLNYRRK